MFKVLTISEDKYGHIACWILTLWLTTHLHLVPRSKIEWSYTSSPQYAFMAWCPVKAWRKLYLLPSMHCSAWV